MKELGLFQTDALIEKLAKAFYKCLDYVVREDYRMQDSTHPTEIACVAMALTAIEEVESALSDDEDAEIINWQQGQSFNDSEYYFCKHGQFTLTLISSPHLNFTRVEVYLENLRIYVFEKDVTKDEATEQLQEFLSTVSTQLQALSQIQF